MRLGLLQLWRIARGRGRIRVRKYLHDRKADGNLAKNTPVKTPRAGSAAFSVGGKKAKKAEIFIDEVMPTGTTQYELPEPYRSTTWSNRRR